MAQPTNYRPASTRSVVPIVAEVLESLLPINFN